MPKVSVVMPMLNAEAYLIQAIASIQAQTLTDWELLIWDDGSIDASIDIAKHYSALDTRIKLLGTGKKGLPRALNYLIASAAASFIARMDADDISLPQRLHIQHDFLERHPHIGVIGSHAITIDNNGNELGRWIVGLHHAQIDDDHINGYRVQIIHPAAMIRLDTLKSVGGYNSESPVEDIDLWLRVAEVSQLANIDLFLINYRILVNSYSQSDPFLRAQQFTSTALVARRRRGLKCDVLPPPYWIDPTPRDAFSKSLQQTKVFLRESNLKEAFSGLVLLLMQRPWSLRAWKLVFYCSHKLLDLTSSKDIF